MVLPNFLVVGAQRCGTTLLHSLLEMHDEVFVPTRKEVSYFDSEANFARGLDWYQSFFPAPSTAARFRAIGEVTPGYLFTPAAAARIKATLPDGRFVAVLRNPVARAWSGYLHHVRSFRETRSFEQFVREERDAIDRGRYAQQLELFVSQVGRERLQVLIFEELLRSPANELARLARFLDLGHGWPEPERLVDEKRNASDLPRFHAGFHYARQIGETLTRLGLDRIVALAKKAGVPRLFGTQRTKPSLPPEARRWLEDLYAPDNLALERWLGRPIEAWH